MIELANIEVYRDGGTIVFDVVNDARLDGYYRLETPFAIPPRVLFRNDVSLMVGGPAESELAEQLAGWLARHLTGETARHFAELCSLREWRNLPERLDAVVRFRYVQLVMQCLRERAGTPIPESEGIPRNQGTPWKKRTCGPDHGAAG